MSKALFNLAQKYKNEYSELILSGSSLADKKEFLNYLYEKAHILEGSKNEQRKTEFRQNREKLNTLITTRRKFIRLLDKSEQIYSKIPFVRTTQSTLNRLEHKKKFLKTYLEEFDEKKELEKLDSYTSLTRQERIGRIKSQKEAVKKEYSQIKAEIAQYIDPAVIQNEKLRHEFIASQWSSYEPFFSENPEFEDMIRSILYEYFTNELQYTKEEVKQMSHDLKNNLITFLFIRKQINKKLKNKEKEIQKNLNQSKKMNSQRISFYNIFAYILTQSDFKVKEDKSALILSFNLQKLYKNFFDTLSHYSKRRFPLHGKLQIDSNHFLLTDFSRTLLKQVNTELKRFNDNILIYEHRGDRMGVKLNLQQILEPLMEDFSHQLPSRLLKRTIQGKAKKRNIGERYHLKIAVPVVIFLILSIAFFAIFSVPDEDKYFVQKYDSVQIDYTAWVSNRSKDYDVLNPIVDIVLWIEMIPIIENDTTGLMLGLYNNLLGRELYYESELIWLDRCIDENRDGIDDLTNETALTYGNSTDQYFNTPLMIKFTILDIEKAPKIDEFPFNREDMFGFILNIFQMVWTITLPILLILIPIVITLIIDFISRHPIDIRKINIRKTFLLFLKYGILIGILVSIPYIVFGIIRLRYSPSLLKIMWMKYPGEIIFIITAISIPLSIATAIMYFLLYKKIR